MNGIKIRGTGRGVPTQVVSNRDLEQRIDTSDEWITSRTGILRRHHCTAETHSSLCAGAARAALVFNSKSGMMAANRRSSRSCWRQ